MVSNSGRELQILSEILKKAKISDSTYTLKLGEVCPCGIGMEYIDGVWYTYSCERGEKYDFNSFSSLDLAVKDLLRMVAPSNDSFMQMYNEYTRKVPRVAAVVGRVAVKGAYPKLDVPSYKVSLNGLNANIIDFSDAGVDRKRGGKKKSYRTSPIGKGRNTIDQSSKRVKNKKEYRGKK